MRVLAALFATLLVALFPAPAQADVRIGNTFHVDKAEYHAATQDLLNKCGSGSPANSTYLPPAVPAAVQAAVDAERRRGFVKYLPNHRTGNGLPVNGFRSERKVDSYITVGTARVQVHKYEYVSTAYVPGFGGHSCDTWVKLVFAR